MKMVKAAPAWVHTAVAVLAIAAVGWTACLLPDINLRASQNAPPASVYHGRTFTVTSGAGSFEIDVRAVTNAQFRRFTAATGYRTTAQRRGYSVVYFAPHGPPERIAGANWQQPFGLGVGVAPGDNAPVVHVSHQDADAYARWIGRQLPTRQQWQVAATLARGESSEEGFREWCSSGDTADKLQPVCGLGVCGELQHADSSNNLTGFRSVSADHSP